MSDFPPGYSLRKGSTKDRKLLIQYMEKTYQELFPELENFSHLTMTVNQYLSSQTPLWWVNFSESKAIACLWMGNAIDQGFGDRNSYIFLLYVTPNHRHQGIGSRLIKQACQWGKERGDRQIGLQVFSQNQQALKLYHRLGFQTQSLFLVKSL